MLKNVVVNDKICVVVIDVNIMWIVCVDVGLIGLMVMVIGKNVVVVG